MNTPQIVKRLLPHKLRRMMRERLVAHSVRHLSGPRCLRLSRNEAAVTCVVKNGEFYIESFIRHYLQMGFQHIFFLDNGSTDQTISIARQHPNVSVCASDLPIDAHQGHFKKYLAQTSSKGGWCLDADIDEFFDYPFSDQISLRDFLEYLNSRRSTAVITQMLDMFSDQPMSLLSGVPEKNLKGVYQHYDLSNATQTGYQGASLVARFAPRNEVTHDKTALYFGGIRKTLYGNNCLLTKHSLFVPEQVELFPHVHFVDHARLADVSCVVLHYKLTGAALQTAEQNRQGFVGNSQGYDDFISFLTSNPAGRVKKDSAARLHNVNDLLARDFLFTSSNYEQFVRDKNGDATPASELASSYR